MYHKLTMKNIGLTFYNDTKVPLAAIIGLCSNYLASEFHYTFTHESEPDVFEINKDDLISDLESILLDKNQINDYVKALDYLNHWRCKFPVCACLGKRETRSTV